MIYTILIHIRFQSFLSSNVIHWYTVERANSLRCFFRDLFGEQMTVNVYYLSKEIFFDIPLCIFLIYSIFLR